MIRARPPERDQAVVLDCHDLAHRTQPRVASCDVNDQVDGERHVSSDRGRERPDQSALPRAGRAAHKHRRAGLNARFKKRRGVRVQTCGRPRRRRSGQGEAEPTEGTDRQVRTADGGDHRIRAASVAHARVDKGTVERELAPDRGGDAMSELGYLLLSTERDGDFAQRPAPLDPDLVGPIHEDIRDLGVVEKMLQRAEAEQLRTELIELALNERCTRGGAHSFPQKRATPRISVDGEKPRRVDPRADLSADPRHERSVDHASARRRTSIARIVGARAANESRARNGSSGIAARSGKPIRSATLAASTSTAPTTTRPTAHGAFAMSGRAQNAAWSCPARVPVTRQSLSMDPSTAESSASAPAPRSRTTARPAAQTPTRSTMRSPAKLA